VLEKEARVPVLCSFGPQTTQTLQENDLEVAVQSAHPSTDGLVDALIHYFTPSS